MAVAVAASCGGDDGTEESSSSTTGSPVTSAPATSLPAPDPADPAVVPVNDRTEVRFDLPGGPDPIAVAAGALWVKRDDGFVVRIDPETDQVVAEIEVAEGLCQGLGAGEEAVWACDERDLARIDPVTNEVAATVPVDKIGEQVHIPVAFDHAWVLTGDGRVLVGVADDEVDVEIDLGLRCSQLTAAPPVGLWASCLTEDAAVLIDLEAEAVTVRVDGLTDTRAIAASEDVVWVSYDLGVAQLDVATGEVLGVADAPTGVGGGLAATADSLWARSGGFLRLVDPGTLEVVEEIVAPEESGGSVLVAFGSVWATAYDDAVLYRLSCGRAACT